MSHLISARRCIAAAIEDPDAAEELLDRAAGHLDAALELVTPRTPEDLANAVLAEVRGLVAIMRGFEDES